MVNRIGNTGDYDISVETAVVPPTKFLLTITFPLEGEDEQVFIYSLDVDAISIDHITRMLNLNGLPYVVEPVAEG